MFGRATITLGIGPHSSCQNFSDRSAVCVCVCVCVCPCAREIALERNGI